MILIVSSGSEDGHIGPVVSELKCRGEDVSVWDPATYPDNSEVTFDGQSAYLSTPDRIIDLSRVRSVWYRRPGEFRLSELLAREEREWLRVECEHLLRAVWTSTPAVWVSEPRSIRAASLKLVQLRLASVLGFNVPDYTVTNSAERAREFLEAHSGGVIVKALANPCLALADRVGFLYTHLVTQEDRQYLSSVRHGPTFLQERISKTVDVRVTVIGSDVFAVGIESDLVGESRIDFRRAEIYDLPHKIIELPSAITGLCRELVRRLDLRFGAIDLLMTESGRFVFLEINPNGQWYWLEEMTGAPMVDSMCNLLSGAQSGS